MTAVSYKHFKKEKVNHCKYYVKTRGSNSKRNKTHFYN